MERLQQVLLSCAFPLTLLFVALAVLQHAIRLWLSQMLFLTAFLGVSRPGPQP